MKRLASSEGAAAGLRRGSALPRLASISVILTACSVLFEPSPARQCSMDSDCEEQPELSGRACDVDHGVCVRPSSVVAANADGQDRCQSSEACTAQNEGQPALCRQPGTPCVPLTTPDCTRLSGSWQTPNAVLLGSVGPQSQRLAVVRDVLYNPFVQRLLDAMDLASAEWQAQRPTGFSFSGGSIAILHCDSAADLRQARRAMAHLTDDLHVPLVFALGDLDLAAITDRALSSQTAVLCVGCYTRSTESSFDDGLIWRLQPALEQQAALAAWRVSDIEQRLRSERGLPEDAPLKVALLTQEYPGITAYGEQLRALLSFNGRGASQNAGNFLELKAPDPRRETVDQLQIARRITDFAPDIIAVGVDTDFTTYYLRMIEEGWSGQYRPWYVTTFMNQELALLEPLVGNDDDLRRRISGTALLADADVTANMSSFGERFAARYLHAPDNVQFGYDGFYAAAYALVRADQQRRFDGPTLAQAFGQLLDGPRVDVGPSAIASGVSYLLSGSSIDLVGASSGLDWNVDQREVSSDVGLWCLQRSAEGALVLEPDAGPRWHATEGTVTGAYACD